MAKKRVGIYIAMMVGDDMKVFPKLRLALRIVHGNYMTKVIHLNYLRFKFISVKKQLTWSIHEEGVLTSFLRLDSLEQILVQFSLVIGF
jgi:hypothetical protein